MTFSEFRRLGAESGGTVTGAMLSGSDYWATTNSVLSDYSEQISDVTSVEYAIFLLLGSSTDDFTTISAFIGIDEGLFTPSDIANFIDGYRLKFAISSVAAFLEDWTANRRRLVRDFLFNRNFPNGKNVFSFVTSEFNLPNAALLAEDPDNPEFANEPGKFLVSPKIAYGKAGHYANIREAEQDYWSIVAGWKLANSSPTTQNKELLSLIRTLLNRNHSNSTYGVPLLMRKPIDKALYSSNATLNGNAVSLVKRGYASLSRNDVSELLNSFIDGLALDLNNFSNVTDYTVPYADFVSYVNERVTALKNKGAAELSVSEAKEVKFYVALMSKFVGTSSVTDYSALSSISSTLESDLDSARAAMLSIRAELIAEGNFY